jgi:two-component system, sensor histidine kinase and response regulator
VNKQPAPIESAADSAVQSIEAPSNHGAPVDFDALRARVENDTTLLEEMVELYLESSPRLLTEIEMGVQARNAVVVQRGAHALKGALQNLSAGPSAEAALQLELQGRSGNVDSMDEILVQLKAELARLQSELNRVFKGVCA